MSLKRSLIETEDAQLDHDEDPPNSNLRKGLRASEPDPVPSTSTSNQHSIPLAHPYVCTLPPTCHRQPEQFATSSALSAHHTTHHAHLCAERGCSKVFPDERFLNLHVAECHDSFVATRLARGERVARALFQFLSLLHWSLPLTNGL